MFIPRVRTIPLAIGALALAWAVVSPLLPAQASSCRLVPIKQAMERYDAIFSGRAIAVTYIKTVGPTPLGHPRRRPCGQKIVTLKVDKVWKGEVGAETKIHSGDGCVGLGGYFTKGVEYLVVGHKIKKKAADPNEPGYSSNVCAGTSRMSEAKRRGNLEWLNENAKPAK